MSERPQDGDAPSPADSAESNLGASSGSSITNTDQIRRPSTNQQKRQSHTGAVLFGLLLASCAVIGLFFFLDLRNRDRYRLHCSPDGGSVALQRGRGIPWPFGFETLGAQFRPITVLPSQACNAQEFSYRAAAESAFCDLLLSAAESKDEATDSSSSDHIWDQLRRARQIAQLPDHQFRQPEVEKAMADLAFSRANLLMLRMDRQLRDTIGMLKDAGSIGKERYDDLHRWIDRLTKIHRLLSNSSVDAAPASNLTPPSTNNLPNFNLPAGASPPTTDSAPKREKNSQAPVAKPTRPAPPRPKPALSAPDAGVVPAVPSAPSQRDQQPGILM